MEWIKVDDYLPKPKDGWNHSDRVLLWYKGTENFCESYGIGYYHYKPPFDDPKWIDFHYAKSRQPDAWQPLPEPPATL